MVSDNNNHASITQGGGFAMDVWESGRQELNEALRGICDRIGANLAAELDHENNAFIPRDKLRALREKAAKADEFEDEGLSLVRQKRALEARLSEVGEKNAEINRLTEHNARLTEELEKHKSTSLRVHELENENKRLAGELKQALSHARDGQTPGSSSFRSTPIPTASELPSFVSRADANGVQAVPKDTYESLVKKFNKLYENYKELKSARDKIEKALTAKKEELKQARDGHDNNVEILDRRVKKREARIEQQNKELQQLRAIVEGRNAEGDTPQDLELVPKSREEREAEALEEVSAALKAASTGLIQYAGKLQTFGDIVSALSPALTDILEASRTSLVSTSSPPKRLSTVSHTPFQSGLGSERSLSRASSKGQDNRAATYELPMLLSSGDNGNDQRVVETEFETLVPHHASTASELTDLSEFRAKIKESPSTEESQSPDTPIVISSRSVPKRKSRKDNTELDKVPCIKVEIGSSSPIGLAALHSLDESIDLDDIGDKQSTPRKGRPLMQQVLRPDSLLANAARNEPRSQHSYSENLTNSQISQVTPVRQTGTKRTNSVLQPRSPNTHILPRTSAERAQKRRRVVSDQAVNELLEDGQLLQSIEETSKKRNTPTIEEIKPEEINRLERLLAKPSPPKHILRLAQPTPTQSKPLRTEGGPALSSRAYEVPQNDMPSDAAVGPPLPKGSTRSRDPAEPPGLKCKGSVRSLKEPPRPPSKGSSRGSVDPPRPTSRGAFRDSAHDSRPTSIESPETRVGPSKHVMPSLKTPVQAPRPSSRDSLVEMQQPSSKGKSVQPKSLNSALRNTEPGSREHTDTPTRAGTRPLRNRPISELKLQDFKVNPNYNQGYGYAFREVVRNQAERRCLPGCTKPECCGNQFRVLAEATRNFDKTPTASQEEADDKILKEYLGDNSYKLRNMTDAEKHETLMLALTRDMANKVGKHKHAYERRQSPPGYWRSDFPNTQEQAEDRAKAEQVQREELAHRYEEAMRRGAYIFRDE